MYKVKKTLEVAASHRISFAGGTQTEPLHGHNWRITVYCATQELDADGNPIPKPIEPAETPEANQEPTDAPAGEATKKEDQDI